MMTTIMMIPRTKLARLAVTIAEVARSMASSAWNWRLGAQVSPMPTREPRAPTMIP